MKYYLTYGINTNKSSMKSRCPDAVSLGKVMLEDHRFMFKFHADAEYSKGSSMECALWTITEQCERSLDALEGFPDYYNKKQVQVSWQGKTISAMIYFIPSYDSYHAPSSTYLNCLIEGYRDHEMNLSQLLTNYSEESII